MRLTRTLKLVSGFALAASAKPLVGQQQTGGPARTGKAEISGVVVDSLHGRYLQGADVILEGANANLVTDSVGRFKFDNLPPGTYRVGVFHPLLDTLGIAVATAAFHVGPDSTSLVVLSIPPATTIIRNACPPTPSGQQGSAVIGHVNDAETLDRVSGAEVSVAWLEIEVSKNVGLRRTPHALRDTTDEAGAFHICGLPNSMDATLEARKGTAATSQIPISIGDADSELFARTLLLTRADAVTTTGSATVSGSVLLEGSATNEGSRVELVGTDIVALTNAKGEFTMTKVPSGSRILLARHLGYGAETATVDLTPREPQKVTIKLSKFVAIMDPVLVTARLGASLDRIGFNERKKSGSGYFLGPEQLQSMHPTYLTDILRRLPSIRVTSNGRGAVVTSRRGQTSFRSGPPCVRYFLDGMPWQSNSAYDINDFVNGNEVMAVEVYQGAQTPARYTYGLGECTTVVLWTQFKIRDSTDQ
jgi:hypothetical protein